MVVRGLAEGAHPFLPGEVEDLEFGASIGDGASHAAGQLHHLEQPDASAVALAVAPLASGSGRRSAGASAEGMPLYGGRLEPSRQQLFVGRQVRLGAARAHAAYEALGNDRADRARDEESLDAHVLHPHHGGGGVVGV